MGIQRYDFSLGTWYGKDPGMNRDDTGDYVLFEDHKNIVKELRESLLETVEILEEIEASNEAHESLIESADTTTIQSSTPLEMREFIEKHGLVIVSGDNPEIPWNVVAASDHAAVLGRGATPKDAVRVAMFWINKLT